MNLPNPISWLGRKEPEQRSTHASTGKPVRISEPQLANALDLIASPPRLGPLGSGATIVRTPMDALAATGTHPMNDLGVIDVRPISPWNGEDDSPILPPQDRGRVPTSLAPRAQESERNETAPRSARSARSPPAPTRAPPSPPPSEPIPVPNPSASPVRPSLKQHQHQSSTASTECFPPVPQVPPHLIVPPTPQPPFAPILVSPLSGAAIDLSKVIVTLESCTVTHRVALPTLLSRPSHLSQWLKSTLPGEEDECSEEKKGEADMDDAASACSGISHSNASGFFSIFHNHLNNEGLISAASYSMHVFLDRPSAPYAHILAYLRTPTDSSATVALPRAAQLTSASSSRLDSLLELRDEATYLGLDELVQLCTDELAARGNLVRTPRSRKISHTRSESQASTTTTLLNRTPTAETPTSQRDSDSASDSAHSRSASPSHERDSLATISTASTAGSARSAPAAASSPPTPPQKDHKLTTLPPPRTSSRHAPTRSNDSFADQRAQVASPPTAGRVGGSLRAQQNPVPVPGLQQRLRTSQQSRGFDTVKARPAAQWI